MFRVIAAFLFATLSLTLAVPHSNLSTTFEWLDGGSYTGFGTLQRRYTYPIYSQTFEVDAALYVSYDQHVISIQTVNNSLGSEWVDSDGHWTLLANGTCLFNPDQNYSMYLADFRELVNVDTLLVCESKHSRDCCEQEIFQGPVISHCDTHSCTSVRTDSQSKVNAFTNQQILFEPDFGVVTKRTDTLKLDHFLHGEPALQYLQRPSACNTPVDFCSYNYPPEYVYHLCL
jgi:hypothetical protein